VTTEQAVETLTAFIEHRVMMFEMEALRTVLAALE